MSKNFSNIPYAQWLEKTLGELFTFPVKGICLNAVTKTGEIYTNYYEVPMMDKLTIAGVIQQDAMLDAMAANGLIEYAEDDDENSNEEKESN